MPKNAVFSTKMTAVLKFVNREAARRESVFFLLPPRSFCRKAIRIPRRKMNIYTMYRFSLHSSAAMTSEKMEGTGVVVRGTIVVTGRTSVPAFHYLFRLFFFFFYPHLSVAPSEEIQIGWIHGLVPTGESVANMSSRRKIVF